MTTIIPNTEGRSKNKNNVKVGKTFESFLHFLKENKKFADNEVTTIRNETLGHLENCDFSEKGSVGLLIGKIQSGKTTSFTAMTALARDNDIPVVIVLGGITNVLVKQSAEDLIQLKNVDENAYFKVQIAQASQATGTPYVDPSSSGFKVNLQRFIDNWSEDEPDYQVSNVIITMKQVDNLRRLTAALEEVDFKNKKVLIIDDETDQHGLNGQIRKSKISSTNMSIKELREATDRTTNHVYLGYTATPTANLLQPLNEHLKPTFVGFISPGNDYVGGEDLFSDNSPYINDEVSVYDQIETEDAPEDLFFALEVFIVGNLVKKIKSGKPPHFSMLIHPDRTIFSHSQCYQWISNRIQNLRNLIPIDEEGLSEEDLEIREANLDDFKKAYDNLSSTILEMPNFNEVRDLIPSFLNKIMPLETNSAEGTGMPDWDVPQANIIIAGDAVNRGTVVQRLTVTYLCRKESKAEDTTQQRGRFYGYKRSYLEYLRVFTTEENARFFKDYVFAEKTMWQNLQNHTTTGKNFDELVFSPIVVKGFKPTRDNVHDKIIVNKDKEGWVIPEGPHFDSVRNINKSIVKTWLDNNQQNFFDWDQDHCKVYMEDENRNRVEVIQPEGIDRNSQFHKTGLFDFNDVFENLVRGFKSEPVFDNAKVLSIKNWLSNLIAMAEASPTEELRKIRSKIRVFLIADGNSRERSLSTVGINYNQKLISQVMSGRSPGASRYARKWYPGDRAFFDPELFTIQIHNFSVKDPVIENAWNLALHIPESISSKYDTAIIDLIDHDRVEDTPEPDE